MKFYILRIFLIIYYCNVFVAGNSDGENVPQGIQHTLNYSLCLFYI